MGEVRGKCHVWLRGMPVAVSVSEERGPLIQRVLQGDDEHQFLDVESVVCGNLRTATIRAADVVLVEDLA